VSGQLKVGVIGQTKRDKYCRSYFAQAAPAPAVVLTDDPGAFSDWARPSGVEVVGIIDDRVRPAEKLRRRTRRRALEWMRSGSAGGARVEQAMRRLRPRPRTVSSERVGAAEPLRHGLIAQLNALHERTGIEEIVVFDLFDLPSVLEFSARTEVRVLVR
jgi:hypothetical protein